eukprot:82198_1
MCSEFVSIMPLHLPSLPLFPSKSLSFVTRSNQKSLKRSRDSSSDSDIERNNPKKLLKREPVIKDCVPVVDPLPACIPTNMLPTKQLELPIDISPSSVTISYEFRCVRPLSPSSNELPVDSTTCFSIVLRRKRLSSPNSFKEGQLVRISESDSESPRRKRARSDSSSSDCGPNKVQKSNLTRVRVRLTHAAIGRDITLIRKGCPGCKKTRASSPHKRFTAPSLNPSHASPKWFVFKSSETALKVERSCTRLYIPEESGRTRSSRQTRIPAKMRDYIASEPSPVPKKRLTQTAPKRVLFV